MNVAQVLKDHPPPLTLLPRCNDQYKQIRTILLNKKQVVQDFRTKCRFCLINDVKENTAASSQQECQKMIENVFPFPIPRIPELPIQVCIECSLMLHNCYTFIQKVRLNQTYLQQRLKGIRHVNQYEDKKIIDTVESAIEKQAFELRNIQGQCISDLPSINKNIVVKREDLADKEGLVKVEVPDDEPIYDAAKTIEMKLWDPLTRNLAGQGLTAPTDIHKSVVKTENKFKETFMSPKEENEEGSFIGSLWLDCKTV